MDKKDDESCLFYKQDLAYDFDQALSIKKQDDKNSSLNLNSGSFGINVCKFTSSPLVDSSFGKLKISSEKRARRLTNKASLSLNRKSGSDFNSNRLIQAVSQNDFNTALNLLKSSKIDINSLDDKQRSCLHIASAKGNHEMVKLLLKHNACPNLRDCVNNLPIHLAIISSHVEVVTLLLEAGTDLSTLEGTNCVIHLAGTRLRWLLNDDNKTANSKLKYEAIQIMNMIKEFLKRKDKKTDNLEDISKKFEKTLSLNEFNLLTNQLLEKFDTFKI